MAGKFELKQSDSGKFHFNLKAGNGRVILSSEMYESRAAAENGIASVAKNAADDARYNRKTATNGEAFFTLTATNGQIIGKSEMYESEAARDNGIESLKTNAPGAAIAETA
jgi:uncharacterized protein YegP (UPF0339 family)